MKNSNINIYKAVRQAKRDLLYNISIKDVYEVYKYNLKGQNLSKNEKKVIFWWNVADIGSKTKRGEDRFEVYKIIKIYYEENHGKNATRRINARLNAKNLL